MEWLIKLGWLLAGCIAGVVSAAFLFGQALIVVIFAIPTAFSLKTTGLLTSWKPLIKYLISFVLLSALACGSAWAMYAYAPPLAFWSYAIYVAAALLFSIRKVGTTKQNIEEFIHTNRKHFDDAAMDRFFAVGKLPIDDSKPR